MESPSNKWVMVAQDLVKVLKKIPGLTDFMINSIDDLSRARNSEEVIGLLNSLAKANPRLRKDILDTVYEHLSDEVKKTVSQLIEEAKSGLDAGRTMEDINKLIDEVIGNLNSKVENIERDLLKMIKDDVDAVVKEYKPKPKPNPPVDEVSDLTQLLRNIENITPGVLSKTDKFLLSSNLPMRQARAFINKELNEFIRKTKDSEIRIAGLIKKAADDLRLGGGQSAEIDETLIKTIAAEIDTLRQSEKFAKEIVFSNLEDALRIGLGDRAQDAATIMSKVRQFDSLNPDAQTWWNDFIKDFYINKMINAPRDATGRVKKLEWFGNFVSRTSSFLISGQLRKFEEIYRGFILNKSIGKKTLGLWIYFTIYSKIILPAFYAIFKSMTYGLTRDDVKDDTGSVYWKIFTDDVKEAFITSKGEYDEEIFDFLSMKGFDDKEIDEVRTILKIMYPFNVYLDDLKEAYDYVVSGKFAEGIRNQTREYQERAEEATGEVLDSVQTAVDSLQTRVELARPELDSILNRRIGGDTTRINLPRTIRSQDPPQ
jgi:hypothetical protein